MANDANLSGHHHFFSDPSAAGDSGLGRNNGVFSYDYIVRDLHEVVDLHAFLDPSPAEPSAINRRVRADLYAVTALNDSESRHFRVPTIAHVESDTIRAD